MWNVRAWLCGAVAALLAPLAAADGISGFWSQSGSNAPVVRPWPETPMQVTASGASLRFSFGATASGTLDLQAPVANGLVVGTYLTVRPWPYEPRIFAVRTAGDLGYCEVVEGTINVLESAFDGATLLRFAANYQLQCAYAARTYGEVRFNSTLPFTFNEPPASTTPDPLVFPARTFVTPSAMIVSSSAEVYGINEPASISVANGAYSINEGPFTSAPGIVSNRDRVRLQLTASPSPGDTSTATLYVGGRTGSFTATTQTLGVPASVLHLQGTTGEPVVGPTALTAVSPQWEMQLDPSFNAPTQLSVLLTGPVRSGSYFADTIRVNVRPPPGEEFVAGRAYENVAAAGNQGSNGGLTVDRDNYCARSSGRYSLLEIGYDEYRRVARLALDFVYTCDDKPPLYGELRYNSALPLTMQKAPDAAVPNPFDFRPAVEVPVDSLVESNEATITGIRAVAGVSVVNGEVSIDGGAFGPGPATIANGGRIRVRTRAPSTPGATTTARVTVGGVAEDFVVQTHVPGAATTGVKIVGTAPIEAFAPTYTLTGSEIGTSAAILRLNGPAGYLGTYEFRVPSTQQLTTGTYESAATYVFDNVPAPAMAIPQSSCLRTGARFVVLDIAYSAGTLIRFAADFQEFCSNGPARFGEIRFNSTVPMTQHKAAGSTTPDPFSFVPTGLVAAGTVVVSNRIGVAGINAASGIAIAGGEYSVNGGPFTATTGAVVAGDVVVVRATAPQTAGATQTATLTIGGRPAAFSVRTYAPGIPVTALAFEGAAGDYLAGARRYFYDSTVDSVVARVNYRNGVSVEVNTRNGTWWSLDLAGPNGSRLVPGVYMDAQRFAFAQQNPGIDLHGDGRGCNQVAGRFIVLEAEYDGNGAIVKFAADFEERCELTMPTVKGQVRINSGIAMAFFATPLNVPRRQFDLDANGKSDILWQHTDGRQAAWTMDGPTQTGGGLLFGGGTGWSVSHVGDFNGDGKSDILWVHTDGRVALWLMSGGTQVGGALLLGAGTGWAPKLVADFDGDGRADIAWLHTDGRSAIWLMNGGTQIGAGALLPAGTGWVPKMAADFDGNGKADILWEHPDGSSALWIMDGTRQVGGGRLFAGGTGWLSRLVADLDGDGKSDIVWVHTDGRTAVWMMNGATQVGGAVIRPAASALQPVLAGDIDGDGRADIIWRAADGTTTFWLMNGTAQIRGGDILAAASGWTVVRVADFSGDRIGDLLLLHTDGRTRMDLFDGYGFVSTPLLAAGTGWTPVPVQ